MDIIWELSKRAKEPTFFALRTVMQFARRWWGVFRFPGDRAYRFFERAHLEDVLALQFHQPSNFLEEGYGVVAHATYAVPPD